MNAIYGIPIFETTMAVTRKVKRVRGGYLNRWLIRAEVMEPAMWHDRINNRFFVHPALMPRLREAFMGAA